MKFKPIRWFVRLYRAVSPQSNYDNNLADIPAITAMILVTLLFAWPLITPIAGQRRAFAPGDFYDQFYSFATYKHDRLWAGEIPLWNPYTFAGHPFLADVQSAVFYPPGLLTVLLNGPGTFSPAWLQAEAIAHFFLAAMFTYLLVRHLTAGHPGSRVAATIGALTFAFGGYLTGYPPLQLAILETQVWLPLILLCLDIGLERQNHRWIAMAGGVWGVALLAGHPQSAMYVFYATILFGLFRAWQRRLPWQQTIIAQLLWIGIGIGLAAIQWLPAWEFMRRSVRAAASYEALAGGFGWQDLVQYILPGRFTLWSPVYVGIMPLLLALGCILTAIFFPRRLPVARYEVLFWAGLALLALILSLGGKTPLFRLFYHLVPGFNLFRSQERAIYLTGFALAVLAGYGWIGVIRQIPERHMPGRTTQIVGPLAVAIIVADLWSVNARTNLVPGPATAQVYDASWLQTIWDGGIDRMINEWGLPGNIGCLLRRHDVSGASPLRLRAHQVLAESLPRWRFWQLLDVRDVVTWEHDLPEPLQGRRLAMQGEEWAKNTVYVHRIDDDFPRAWIVHRARHVRDLEVLSILADERFDPWNEVLLAQPPPAGFETTQPTAPSSVHSLTYRPEQIALEVELNAPGWLVLSEWDYPGWQARVDGVRTPIYRADYALRAVPLTAGRHTVEFRYRPASVYVGGLLSMFSIAALTVLLRKRQIGSIFASIHPPAGSDVACS